MSRVSLALIGSLVLLSANAVVSGPRPNVDLATCTRSATLLACADRKGNSYSVATVGQTLYLRGYESNDERSWAQTNTYADGMTFFTGLASDGEVWIGTIQRVGWTTITRLSSSDGTRSKITCSRLSGCR